MSNSLDVEEKINILFKNYLGFPNTNKNKEYYNEDTISFSNYHLGEDIFLKTIPTNPIFNESKNSSYLSLNDNDFYEYNSNSSILEDSSGIIVKITKLKLEIVPNSEGRSFYKLDISGNNVLKDSLSSSKNRYTDENGILHSPYIVELFSSLNEFIFNGYHGGDWQFDVKNGIIYFPNLGNITEHLIDKDNPPYLTFCKYIGKKGLEILDTEINNSLNNKAPINSPEFTGVPTAPTASLSTYNEQIATTKYVKDRFEDLVNLSPNSLETLTDLSNALAQDSNLSTTIIDLIAQKEPRIETSTDLSFNKLELLSDLSGQDASFNNVSINNLVGIINAPTAALNTNTSQIATTEFVTNAITDISNNIITQNKNNIISLNDSLTKNINDLAAITMFGLINIETNLSDLSENLDLAILDMSQNIDSTMLDISNNLNNRLSDLSQNLDLRMSDISQNLDLTMADLSQNLNSTVIDISNNVDNRIIDLSENYVKINSDNITNLQNTKQDNIISSTDINLNNLKVSGDITASNSNLDINTINLNGNMIGQDVSFNNMDVTNISDGISFKKLGSSIPLTSEILYEDFEDSNVNGTISTLFSREVGSGYSGGTALRGSSTGWGYFDIDSNNISENMKAISFWYKPDTSGGNYQRIWWPSNTQNVYPHIDSNHNTNTFQLNIGSASDEKVNKWAINGVNQTIITGNPGTTIYNIETGKEGDWHHIYIELTTTKPSTRFLARGAPEGQLGDGGSDYWNSGLLDEIRLFNLALSDDQIADLAAGNNGNVDGGDNRTEVKLLGDMSGAYVNVNFKNVDVGSHLQCNDASFNNIESTTIKLGSNDLQTTLDNLQNSKQNNLTFGISDDNTVKMHDTASVNDYAKFSSTGLIGMTYNEVKIDLNLDNVTNESKSTMFTDPVFTGSPKLNTKELATQEYVTTQINNLVDGAPDALNTLNELAAAIGDDNNYAAGVTNTITNLSNRVDASLNDLSVNFIKVNRDNISALQSEKQDNINNTMDISLKNLDVYGDLCGNDVSFNNIETSTINLNGFDLESAISNIKNGNIDYSTTSASDLSDISFNVNTLEHGRSLLWNSDKNMWEPGIVNQIKKQQITEVIIGICNGKSINAESGDYTLPNVSNIQEINPKDISSSQWEIEWYNDNSIFEEITGSNIQYKPPVDTKQIIYSYNFSITEVNTQGYGGSSLWFRFFIDGQEVSCQRKCISNHVRSGTVELKYILMVDPTLSEDDISNGLFKSWNSNKELKIDVCVYLNKIKLYSANWDGNNDVFTRPLMEIKSIGLSTSGGSGNSDREKISTLENTISNLQNIISNLQQRLDDGGL